MNRASLGSISSAEGITITRLASEHAQLFSAEGNPALVAALVRSFTPALASSKTTTAVLSLNETVTFDTPETCSMAFLTMYGQASQYILSTVKVTVRSAAEAAWGETKKASARKIGSLAMLFSLRIEQRREEAETDCRDDERRRHNKRAHC